MVVQVLIVIVVSYVVMSTIEQQQHRLGTEKTTQWTGQQENRLEDTPHLNLLHLFGHAHRFQETSTLEKN